MRSKRTGNREEKKLRGKKHLLALLAVCVALASMVLAAAHVQRARSPVPAPPTDSQGTSSDAAPEEEPAIPVHAPHTEIPTLAPGELEGRKLVALTFDDGPHPEHTSRLLDVLRSERVRATFFVLGTQAEKNPDVLLRAAADGHQIGNHTYNHKDLTKLGPEQRGTEIERGAALIEDLTGLRPAVMRPPYGASNKAVQDAADTPLILWQIDPRDWSTRDADKSYEHVMVHVQDGDIILLHDIYEATVDAAERLIPALKAQGYIFVTVDQLLDARGGAGPGEIVRNRPAAEPTTEPAEEEALNVNVETHGSASPV